MYHKASVKFRGVTNWVMQSEKYINMAVVLNHHGAMVEN
jgi:hypothetical protein